MTVRQCKFYCCVERLREINKVVDFGLRKSSVKITRIKSPKYEVRIGNFD